MIDIINKLGKASLLDIKEKKTDSKHYILDSDINPYSLYLYLHARFGKPNGLLSLVRNEDSDQLFHWHFSLKSDDVFIEIMCATYRLEVVISESIAKDEIECRQFLELMVKDIKNVKENIPKVKAQMEDWIEIINPFKKLQQQISLEFQEIDKSLLLIENMDRTRLRNRNIDNETFQKWIELVDTCSMKSFSIRCMIPVYIETFINLILHIKLPEEVKKDDVIFEGIIRKQIHDRFLEINNCLMIQKKVSVDDIYWKKVHSIFNNRNDLLHGNINIKRLKFNEVSFIKSMPLFKSFSTYEKDIMNNSYFEYKEIIEEEIKAAEEFFYYVLLSFELKEAEGIKVLLDSYSLGFNKENKRFGKLFKDDLVDYNVELGI